MALSTEYQYTSPYSPWLRLQWNYVALLDVRFMLRDMAALFNCQLLSEVTQLIESGYLCRSTVWHLYPFPNDNDPTF